MRKKTWLIDLAENLSTTDCADKQQVVCLRALHTSQG
jgi:hypothetical protein